MFAIGSFVVTYPAARVFRHRVDAVERVEALSSTLEVMEALVGYGLGGISVGLGLALALLVSLVMGCSGWRLWLAVAAGLVGMLVGFFVVAPRMVGWYRWFFRRRWGL